MTFAWYGHLKTCSTTAVVDRGARSRGASRCSSTCCRCPANRIGYTVLSLAQLKILQEVITLVVFVPFAMLFMGATLKLDYLWAGLCMIGAVYFIFRS